MNDVQESLLRHMLGADSRYLKKEWGFRNYFCADNSDECPDNVELIKMESQGMVISCKRQEETIYFATKEGALAIGFKPYQLRKVNFHE